MLEKKIVFVLGGPGCGKGTQCKLIVEKYGWGHTSTGDLLRAEVESSSAIGEQCRELMEKGQMVPDEAILQLLARSIEASDHEYILIDGFPRRMTQIKKFE